MSKEDRMSNKLIRGSVVKLYLLWLRQDRIYWDGTRVLYGEMIQMQWGMGMEINLEGMRLIDRIESDIQTSSWKSSLMEV